ncbi:MAG: hypothetical protein ACRD4O_11850, partial [Bryobacteraceae bacterium]
ELNKVVTSALLLGIIHGKKIAIPDIPTRKRYAPMVYFSYYGLFVAFVAYALLLGIRHGVPLMVAHYVPLCQRAYGALGSAPLSAHAFQMVLGLTIATVSMVGLLLVCLRIALFVRDEVYLLMRARLSQNRP